MAPKLFLRRLLSKITLIKGTWEKGQKNGKGQKKKGCIVASLLNFIVWRFNGLFIVPVLKFGVGRSVFSIEYLLVLAVQTRVIGLEIIDIDTIHVLKGFERTEVVALKLNNL